MAYKFDFLKKRWVHFYHFISFLEIVTFPSSEGSPHSYAYEEDAEFPDP